MKTIMLIIHAIFAISLVSLILLQSSKGGLGSAFGGGEQYRSKRGAEKMVFYATVVVAILFMITSVLNLIIR